MEFKYASWIVLTVGVSINILGLFWFIAIIIGLVGFLIGFLTVLYLQHGDLDKFLDSGLLENPLDEPKTLGLSIDNAPPTTSTGPLGKLLSPSEDKTGLGRWRPFDNIKIHTDKGKTIQLQQQSHQDGDRPHQRKDGSFSAEFIPYASAVQQPLGAAALFTCSKTQHVMADPPVSEQ